MVTPLADLPAWAQVTIALTVPLNTLIGIVGAIALRRMAERSRKTRTRQRAQNSRIAELEEELRQRRNGVV